MTKKAMTEAHRLLLTISRMPLGAIVKIGREVDRDASSDPFLTATVWTDDESDRYEGMLFGISAADGDTEALARRLADAIDEHPELQVKK